MAVYKCKICGGSLDVKPGDSIAECEYCGTKQTLPKLVSDQRINLFERANQFLQNNNYDKAMELYEQILHDDITDAEAYWSLVLCKYGIEYVEDPASHKWIPTVNRVQYTPIVSDTDYKSAIQYATDEQKPIYEAEAQKIDNIQKEILAIAAKEDPYDIFICYKETDEKGRRTPDSVLANDIYYMLTDEGYKVFFSRITLEDKLGTAYEPYIFNALNSAKIMLVIGTKPEYFNAVWVKNEWSRFMKLMEKDHSKMLIPCYRDMDPYNLPEEFAHLQAQDMSKLGFSQDLLRGVKKILDPSIPNETIHLSDVSSEEKKAIDLSIKKMFLSLEEEDWKSAKEHSDKILDIDPTNGQAYLGRLMIDLRVSTPVDLQNSQTIFEDNLNYKRALRYCDPALKSKLEEYNSIAKGRIKTADLEEVYQRARSKMNIASTEDDWESLSVEFDSIAGYKDADSLKEKCLESIDSIRVENLYACAKSLQKSNKKGSIEEAVTTYKKIANKRDVNEEIDACQRKLREIQEKEEAEAKRKKAQSFLLKAGWGVLGVILEIISAVIILLGGDGINIGILGAVILMLGSFAYYTSPSNRTEIIIGIVSAVISFLIAIIMDVNYNGYSAYMGVGGLLALLNIFISFVVYYARRKFHKKKR